MGTKRTQNQPSNENVIILYCTGTDTDTDMELIIRLADSALIQFNEFMRTGPGSVVRKYLNFFMILRKFKGSTGNEVAK